MRFLSEHFQLRERGTTPRIEVVAGTTTFLTMAYVIFVQPAVLSGSLFGTDTGMDFGAVTTATCLAAALATAIMGLYARYPIALAPGMGQNFFFVFTAIPVAAAAGSPDPWRAALGAVFIAGVAFLIVSVLGIRERIIDAVSPSLKHAIAVGIGVFVAFIGLRNAQVIVADPGTAVRLNARFLSPDIVVFVVGFLVAAALHARRIAGSIVWGIAAGLVTALVLRAVLPLLPVATTTDLVRDSRLWTQFAPAQDFVSLPPSLGPTLFQMDLGWAVVASMIPIVVIFFFMDVFDTVGTLIGLGQRAGMLVENKLPRAQRAMMSDAVGTVVGASLGTSTVTSYIESASGIEQGGKTGLTALVVATWFLLALFFYPIVSMVGSYPPITAPALVLVGAMMARNVTQIQ